jgi:hypothetical protein
MSRTRKQPYRGARAIDPSCRSHGDCPWCKRNRDHAWRKRLLAPDMEDFLEPQRIADEVHQDSPPPS